MVLQTLYSPHLYSPRYIRSSCFRTRTGLTTLSLSCSGTLPSKEARRDECQDIQHPADHNNNDRPDRCVINRISRDLAVIVDCLVGQANDCTNNIDDLHHEHADQAKERKVRPALDIVWHVGARTSAAKRRKQALVNVERMSCPTERRGLTNRTR